MKLIVGCLLCFFTFAVAAADLRMLTDNHPPLHFQQGSELVGFGVDVVRSLAERTGDQLRMEQVPLLRALRVASTEPNTAVFIVLRTAEREAHYQWVGPLMEVETALYAGNAKARSVRSLQQVSSLGRIACRENGWPTDTCRSKG